MNKKEKNKLINYWTSLIKRKKEMEKKKKEEERLSLFFYFKKAFIVTTAFSVGLFVSPKKKKQSNVELHLEEHLENIKKIRKKAEEENTIDKINDCRLSLEMEEVELDDTKNKMEDARLYSLFDACKEELYEAEQVINKKIENFENRLQDNLVKVGKQEKTLEKESEIENKEKIEKLEDFTFAHKKEDIKKEEVLKSNGEKDKKLDQYFDENLKRLEKINKELEKNKQEEKVLIVEKKAEQEEKKETIVVKKDEQKEQRDEVISIIEDENIEIEEKKVEKKEEKQRISKEEVFDFMMMSKLIDENIKKNKEKVEKLKKEMKEINPVLRKNSFLGKLKGFISGIMKTALSLLPMKLFKNKTIGILTSSVLINNSVRGMRNTMRKEEFYIDYLSYDRINNKVTSTISDMDKIYYICEDSLEQMNALKAELLNRYEMTEDLEKILAEITSLEVNVTKKMKEVENTKKDLSKSKEEVKQKILRKDV